MAKFLLIITDTAGGGRYEQVRETAANLFRKELEDLNRRSNLDAIKTHPQGLYSATTIERRLELAVTIANRILREIISPELSKDDIASLNEHFQRAFWRYDVKIHEHLKQLEETHKPTGFIIAGNAINFVKKEHVAEASHFASRFAEDISENINNPAGMKRVLNAYYSSFDIFFINAIDAIYNYLNILKDYGKKYDEIIESYSIITSLAFVWLVPMIETFMGAFQMNFVAFADFEYDNTTNGTAVAQYDHILLNAWPSAVELVLYLLSLSCYLLYMESSKRLDYSHIDKIFIENFLGLAEIMFLAEDKGCLKPNCLADYLTNVYLDTRYSDYVAIGYSLV